VRSPGAPVLLSCDPDDLKVYSPFFSSEIAEAMLPKTKHMIIESNIDDFIVCQGINE
jgi:hypothetical protein